MINLIYSLPFTGEMKTLRLKGHVGIGNKEAEDGKIWDVHGYIGAGYANGKAIVHARPVDNCPKYSTATWDLNKGWNISYLPYYVEWIN
jgi:hypothetical protein